jgi:hypothetical protein
LLFLIIGTTAVYWNEARKEVTYLCGNFIEGITQSSVLEQLDTANLSSYRITDTPTGKRIEFASILNAGFYRCIIEISAEGNVKGASIE